MGDAPAVVRVFWPHPSLPRISSEAGKDARTRAGRKTEGPRSCCAGGGARTPAEATTPTTATGLDPPCPPSTSSSRARCRRKRSKTAVARVVTLHVVAEERGGGYDDGYGDGYGGEDARLRARWWLRRRRETAVGPADGVGSSLEGATADAEEGEEGRRMGALRREGDVWGCRGA